MTRHDMPQDTALRAWVKGGLWTLIGLGSMALVGFVLTGSMETGGTLALINSAIGLLSYVIYERVWARISWGRNSVRSANSAEGGW